MVITEWNKLFSITTSYIRNLFDALIKLSTALVKSESEPGPFILFKSYAYTELLIKLFDRIAGNPYDLGISPDNSLQGDLKEFYRILFGFVSKNISETESLIAVVLFSEERLFFLTEFFDLIKGNLLDTTAVSSKTLHVFMDKIRSVENKFNKSNSGDHGKFIFEYLVLNYSIALSIRAFILLSGQTEENTLYIREELLHKDKKGDDKGDRIIAFLWDVIKKDSLIDKNRLLSLAVSFFGIDGGKMNCFKDIIAEKGVIDAINKIRDNFREVYFENQSSFFKKILHNSLSKKAEFTFQQIILLFAESISEAGAYEDKYLIKGGGQIFTPLSISKIMAEASLKYFSRSYKISRQRSGIRSHNDIFVLDPASGIGILLMTLGEVLTRKQNIDHPKIHLIGYELNLFTLMISEIFLESFINSLGSKNGECSVVDFNLFSGDFLTERALNNCRRILRGKGFDIIIANPPYIKQEIIPGKKSLMELHMKIVRLFSERTPNNNVGDAIYNNLLGGPEMRINPVMLSARTDYYGFFIWFSSLLLKDGGILCFLIPNKWLDVQYGNRLKEFLLNNFKILSIVELGSNFFSNAQVTGIILIAQKCLNTGIRGLNSVKIIRVMQKISGKNFRDTINGISSDLMNVLFGEIDLSGDDWNKHEFGRGNDAIVFFESEKKSMKVSVIPQRIMNNGEKWGVRYLFQSIFYFILEEKIKSGEVIPLDNHKFTEVIGGLKTGANSFFFINKKDAEKMGFDKRFLKNGIRSGRDIPDYYIIEDVHLKDMFLSVDAAINLERYPALKRYVDNGSRSGIPSRPSLNWEPWYCIPEEKQTIPDIIFLRHINTNFKARWNRARAVVADGIRGLKVLSKELLMFFLGVCNSTFFYWQAHLKGRWEGQGALQLLVYELKAFLIPNPEKIPEIKIKKVEEIMEKLIRGDYSQEDSEKLKEKLDKAVLDCINLADSYDLLRKETETMEYNRINKSKL